jgi:transposase
LPDTVFCLLPVGVTVDRLLPADDTIIIEAHATSPSASCPLCQHASSRRQSTYRRRLADLPWQGRTVRLHLQVRRFRCGNDACPRSIFVERLPEVTTPMARRTTRLRELQQALGLALGGEPSARLAIRLAMPVSADTVLRMIRAAPVSVPVAPRVVGVDDLAFRRGQRYGTILCDLERNRAIDLLPDRQAGTLAAWLKRHPSIEIVARDRAGAYADGIRQGAPGAIQVSDRWHLLRNGSDALQGVFDRHHREVRRAIEAAAASGPATPRAEEPKERVAAAVRRSRERLAQRQARYAEVARLHAQGVPMARIARTLGMGFSSVRRWLRAGQAPLWRKPPRPKQLDRYQAYLERRWQEGCRGGTQLWRDLRAQGFAGGRSVVCDWARQQRRDASDAAPAVARRPSPRVPTSRQAVRLVLAEAEPAGEADRRLVGLLVTAAPTIELAVLLARRFGAMIKARDHAAFRPWLAAARGSALAGFAQEALERDGAAVEAALTLPWSTGPVEGRITQLKLIKRQMYGRASFDLLRHRVLAAT